MAQRRTISYYTGDALRKNVKEVGKDEKKELYAYLPDKKLVEAVNLAMVLGRPLLIMGEPGCGKTRLAESVAYELHGKDMFDERYFRWNVKSTSKAKDGLYTYKALKYFQHSQAGKETKDGNNEEFIKNYIQKGALGKAIDICDEIRDNPDCKQPVVLIDEIDKASLDFPNDLLFELDKMSYEIEELAIGSEGQKVATGDLKPLILITSNNEKELPAAFLRRCLFYEIKFPEKDELARIVHSRFDNADAQMVSDTIERFLSIRNEQENTERDSDKKVSTSELIDWFKVLSYYSGLPKEKPELSDVEKELVAELEKLKLNEGLPPFYQVLLKNTAWIERFRK